MAITITEKFRAGLGSRKIMSFEITHDEADLSISAAELDLKYIDWYQHAYTVFTSAPADTSITARYLTISISATRDKLFYPQTPKAGSKSSLLVIGW